MIPRLLIAVGVTMVEIQRSRAWRRAPGAQLLADVVFFDASLDYRMIDKSLNLSLYEDRWRSHPSSSVNGGLL
jgi:hypothetical protein